MIIHIKDTLNNKIWFIKSWIRVKSSLKCFLRPDRTGSEVFGSSKHHKHHKHSQHQSREDQLGSDVPQFLQKLKQFAAHVQPPNQATDHFL